MEYASCSAEVIERVRGKDGELQLQRRGKEFEFIFNGVFLMASYNGAAEREMVKAALKSRGAEHAAQPSGKGRIVSAAGTVETSNLRVLMGGLGMGLGLQEALRFPGVERVDLFELEEAVVRWNRGPLSELNGGAMQDPRVNVIQGDMVDFLKKEEIISRKENQLYHAVILDTDNGPGWLSRPENAFLYNLRGTRLLRELLLPGGSLSVWSSAPVPRYLALLQTVFVDAREKELLEKTGQTSYYYLAVK